MSTRLYIKPRWDWQYYKQSFGAGGWLLKKIKHAVEWESFIGIIIHGREGSGKSMTALKLMRCVYGSWKTALALLYYRWDDLRGTLDAVNAAGAVLPAVWWDDMGVYASRYLYRLTNRAIEMNAMVNLIREHSRALIGTAPNPQDIAKLLREREGWIKCWVRRADREHSYMRCVEYVYNERRDKLVAGTPHEGVVNIIVPDDIYVKYKAIRRKYYVLAKEDLKHA